MTASQTDNNSDSMTRRAAKWVMAQPGNRAGVDQVAAYLGIDRHACSSVLSNIIKNKSLYTASQERDENGRVLIVTAIGTARPPFSLPHQTHVHAEVSLARTAFALMDQCKRAAR